ncbi:MAG: IS200/IS605 family transposase [Bacteroidota bacterium]
MAFVNIMVHVVWGTKNRFPFLKKDTRAVVYDHIRQNARSKQIFIDSINGVEDHIHALLGLNADLSIAKTIQLIKGESSFWINKQKIMSSQFEWADEYYAVSVSEGQLDDVRRYISIQEEHHQKKTFLQECEEFLKHHNFNKFQG